MSIQVLQVRGSCHLQDRGRPAQASIGIPMGGFADMQSAYLANQLVSRSAYNPLLECTLGGPTLRFKESCDIAITGADVQPRIDGLPIALWQRVHVQAGATLSCQHSREGLRSYIAFSRSLNVEMWRDSVSPLQLGECVFPKASILVKNQVLKFGVNKQVEPFRIAKKYAFKPAHFAVLNRDLPILLTLQSAPESDLIKNNEKLLTELLASVWSVSSVSSRMGIRLAGTSLTIDKAGGLMRSGPVLPGTVQLLPDGNLIITHVDSQTIGGYPRIGLVDAFSLAVLAQAVPGKTRLQLRF